MKKNIFISILSDYFWLILLFIGAVFSYIVMFIMPHEIYINTIWEPTFKVVSFTLVIFGISFFPNKGKYSKYNYFLLFIPLLVFLVYIIPRISYYGFIGIPNDEANCYDKFYTYLWLFLYPAIICTTIFAYRIGGGKSSHCIKLGLVPVIALFSGLLDIVWLIVNNVDAPNIIEANHIRIIIGRWPTYNETIIFALCHIPLVIIVMLLPLDKWFSLIKNKYFITNNNKSSS